MPKTLYVVVAVAAAVAFSVHCCPSVRRLFSQHQDGWSALVVEGGALVAIGMLREGKDFLGGTLEWMRVCSVQMCAEG